MPRRLTDAAVRQEFYDAGYQLPNNFQYVNVKHKHKVLDKFTNEFAKLSLQQLRYRVKKGLRPSWQDLPLPDPQQQPQPSHVQQLPVARYVNRHTALQGADRVFINDSYAAYVWVMSKINRKQTFTYDFEENLPAEMFGITLALSDSLAKIQRTHNIADTGTFKLTLLQSQICTKCLERQKLILM